MPARRSRTHQRVTAVTRLQQGRPPAATPTSGNAPLPADQCVVSSCSAVPLPDCPVPLCGKHTREVWQYTQGVIEDRLLAALQVME